jgi:hypothetical protein
MRAALRRGLPRVCGILDGAMPEQRGADSLERVNPDSLAAETRKRFEELVASVGIKRFAQSMCLSTRQVNRMLSGAQPNPIERLIRCLQAGDVAVGDRIADYVCQELGGHFVRQDAINDVAVNAVKECAEAIAAISDGQISDLDVRQIREAISALSGLIYSLRAGRRDA